jgi:molybdopterin-guanine dinucleotide biosynthesis protein A
MTTGELATVVLAGGAARRLGGVLKAALPVGGRPMLLRVLDAVPSAGPRIVVGPPALAPLLPPDVELILEDPPGGGPVAALAAAVRLLPVEVPHVAVLSADLPFLTPVLLDRLSASLDGGAADVAVPLDGDGRRQLLCAVWRASVLRHHLAAFGDPAGVRMRDLMAGAVVHEARVVASVDPPPWFDCDTDSDLRRAEEWASADPG